MTLGQRVKFRRLPLGLTITEAAERAGLDSGYWSRLENDKYADIGHTRLARIAAVLECTVAELLGEELPAPAPLPAWKEALLRTCEVLPLDRRQRVMEFAIGQAADLEVAEDFLVAMR